MTRQLLGSSGLRAVIGGSVLMVVLAMPVLADNDDSGSDDSGSDGSYTQHNTGCDPGYPEGVCVQSPTQSENNTTSEG